MAYASSAASQWQTYDAGPGAGDTIREDLSDVITIMSPLDTPLLSMLPHVQVANDLYEWPLDDIPTPNSAAGKVEGADAVFPDVAAVGEETRYRTGNSTVITAEYVDVSDSQRTVNLAGVEDEFAYQVWKKTLRMAKQMEFNLHWGSYAAGSGATPGTARQTEGFVHWAFELGVDQTSGITAGSSTWDMTATTGRQSIYRPTVHIPGSAANLTRVILHDSLLTPAWRAGMQVEGCIVLLGAEMKFLVADFAVGSTGFAAINERIMPAEARTMIDTIDIIRTDFGYIYMNLDRYLDGPDGRTVILQKTTSPSFRTFRLNQTILIFQPGMLEIAVMRPASFTLLAKIGDATKGMCVMEAGTKLLNPLGLIMGTDLVA